MEQTKDEFKRGVTELLVLHLLLDGPKYGYEISQLLDEKSGSRYVVSEGTLYPLLYKMEDRGFIVSAVTFVTKRRMRRAYEITDAGRGRYAVLLNNYLDVTDGAFLVLGKG